MSTSSSSRKARATDRAALISRIAHLEERLAQAEGRVARLEGQIALGVPCPVYLDGTPNPTYPTYPNLPVTCGRATPHEYETTVAGTVGVSSSQADR